MSTTPPPPSGPPDTAAGLAGVVITTSSRCFIDGAEGILAYRGYNIHELAGRASFEETAHLLWTGELPNRQELDQLRDALAAGRPLAAPVMAMLRSLPKSAGAMESLRSAVSLASIFDPDTARSSPEANHRKAIRLTAQMGTILAAHTRLSQGLEPVPPDPRHGQAASFLAMLGGEEPSRTAVEALDLALVLHGEHGFNASTFAARVAASTLADMHSATVAAIATLKGPLHGGANRAVMQALEEIGTVERVPAWVKEKLRRKERVMGFGHRVYRTMDPRAVHLKKMAEALGRNAGDSRWFDMSAAMGEVMMQEKGLYPNVDFYSASAYRSLGIPPRIFPAVFACSRIAGWSSHVMEQLADNRLIRPRCEYVGPHDRRFQPLDERA
ncbi:MAG: citrate/2-methylcitrate synthase [Acidobacteriota bacterium]